MFFWAGIICLIDVTIRKPPSGDGFRFDIFNDSVGMALFICGLYKLKKTCHSFRCSKYINFLLFVSVAYFIVTIHSHVIYSVPTLLFVSLTGTIYCFYLSFFVAYLLMGYIFRCLGYDRVALLWRANSYLLAVALLAMAIMLYFTNVGSELSVHALRDTIQLLSGTIIGHRYRLYFSPFIQFIYTAPFILSLFILYYSKRKLSERNDFDNG